MYVSEFAYVPRLPDQRLMDSLMWRWVDILMLHPGHLLHYAMLFFRIEICLLPPKESGMCTKCAALWRRNLDTL